MTELSRYIASKKKLPPPAEQPKRYKCNECCFTFHEPKPLICHCGSKDIRKFAEQPKPRKPMRRVSKERAKLMRDVKDWRHAFIGLADACQVCHRHFVDGCSPLPWMWLNVHEIAKGPAREEAMKHRECCLVVCNECNSGPLCDYSLWPIERQLALKLVTDPLYFDLDLFNAVRGRAASAITIFDVAVYLNVKEKPKWPSPLRK